MDIYELVNPSDETTFKAENDKIACYCTVILGSGKYGCGNLSKDERQENISALLLFSPDPITILEKYLGSSLSDFAEMNNKKIIRCFESFSYCSYEERKIYDEAVEAITDVNKLKVFKAGHEDRNRSSMNQIVKNAWKWAEHYSTS